VISRDRLKDIPELIRFTEDIGADTIKFSNFHPTGDRTEKRPLYFGDEEVMAMLKDITGRNGYKVNIMLPQLFGASDPPYSCRMLASVVVGSKGDYSPCCRIIPEAKWGNFFTTGEKHNSAPLKTFRLEVMRANNIAALPLICRECSHLAPQRPAFSREHRQWFLSNVS
jgi:radical SAM protein with 4Fe4S-binding SPASM domain